VRGLLGVPASVVGLLQRDAHAPLDIVGIGRACGILQPLDRSASRDSDCQRPAQKNGQQADEQDRYRIHGPSMAHPADFG